MVNQPLENNVAPGVQQQSWKNNFFQHPIVKLVVKGMVVSLPVIIILFIISLLFKLILKVLTPISLILYPVSTEPHWSVHFISLIVLVGFFYLIGRALASPSGQLYLGRFESEYLMQIPLYSTIRDLIQQFAGIQEMPFSKVVLVDPFDSGVLMTGFITEEISKEIYTVFVPTAPNPTNGNIYHVPASRLKFINIKSEAAMRTIVGMGTGSSCLFPKDNLDDLEKVLQTPPQKKEELEKCEEELLDS